MQLVNLTPSDEKNILTTEVPQALVHEAQRSGLSFATILSLVATYGPQALDLIRQILAALKKPADPTSGI